MPIAVVCPACGARLRAPDAVAGRRVPCPKCRVPVDLPAGAGPGTDFAFPPALPAEFDAEAGEPTGRQPGRRPAARRKPAAGYNPFDPRTAADEPTPDAPRKRPYRKDADYNPFEDAPDDAVGEGFDFGGPSPPPPATGEFDFGPLDPRGNDSPDRPGRRPG